MNRFKKIIEKVLKKTRGANYELNQDVDAFYLLRLIGSKVIDRLYGNLRFGTLKSVYVSPSSSIRSVKNITFGRNLMIGPKCYIDAMGSEGIVCGDRVSFGRETTMIVTGSLQHIGKGIMIGNNVGLGTRGHIGGAGGVTIGDDTIIGNYVSIHPENHNFSDLSTPIRLQGVNHKGIVIGKGCWIGAKATILDGTRIGNGCVVAAGAVVSGTFPDNVIIGGVPAKIIKKRNETLS